MCLFPLPNYDVTSSAYKKGVTSFNCGACPECLSSRANTWALRAVYEAKDHFENCMCTLTYDTYIYDKLGNVIGERVSDMHVCKRDVQLFIKRLRKKFPDKPFKYLITSEYGKRTHRAHYHCLFFGLSFSDAVFYKLSKRGNIIYKSKTLTEVWNNGICTVDCLNVGASVARYCTKYCAKDSRSDDTFMLTSHNIGISGLLTDFNGLSYIVDGREYPIPRKVWQIILSARYRGCGLPFTTRYFNRPKERPFGDPLSKRDFVRFRFWKGLLNNYYYIRDNDNQYQNYIAYWNEIQERVSRLRETPFKRLLALPNEKYYAYKQKALKALSRRLNGVPCVAPRSNSRSAFERWHYNTFHYLPFSSRHNTANDTNHPPT